MTFIEIAVAVWSIGVFLIGACLSETSFADNFTGFEWVLFILFWPVVLAGVLFFLVTYLCYALTLLWMLWMLRPFRPYNYNLKQDFTERVKFSSKIY